MSRKSVLCFVVSFCAVFYTTLYAADFPDFNSGDEEINSDGNGKAFLDSIIDSLLKKPGFTLVADYSIVGAYYPGWSASPWDEDFLPNEILQGKQPFGAEIRAKVGLEIRVSPQLSFWQSVKFAAPGMTMQLNEFYGSYVFMNRTFFKVGKFDYGWGRSPNFDYTNLISRVPETSDEFPGELYLARANIPIGKGSLEFVGFTRDAYFNPDRPEINSFAFGGKLNIVTRAADADIGALYFSRMPFRAFFSLKATILSTTEIYAEALFAVNHDPYWSNSVFSCSAGFFNDFFKGRIRINGEVYYNGESDARFLRVENILEDKKKVFPLAPGINTAFNIDCKTGLAGSLRLGIGFRYSVNDGSGQVIPGIITEPAKHLKIYFAVPFVVGSRSGESYSYYVTNEEKNNRPISIILAISLNGAFEFSRYRDN